MSDAATTVSAPAYARAMTALARFLSQDFLGGPRVLKLAWVINAQKAGTAPFVLFLMWWYGTWSAAAWIYLALHGTYGLCWLLKDRAFADRRWEVRVTWGGGVMAFLLVLGPYWVAPWILTSGALGGAAAFTPSIGAICVAAHTLGVVIMMVADAQKHFTLRERRGLITDGLYARCRHPNYLGEMMVYGSYALLVGHWLPWAILAWVWLGVFVPNMLMAEASLARYPGWKDYRARTGFLLPRFPVVTSGGVPDAA